MTCRPLFYRYDGQINPQRSYVEIDDDGNICTKINWEIGNAIPVDVYNGDLIWVSIDCSLTQTEINKRIKRIEPLVKVLLENSEMIYDGQRNKRKYTELGANTLEKISMICSAPTDDYDLCDDDDCEYCMIAEQ